MKILFYNHTGKVSGAERMLLTILKGLDRERFEPVVVCPDDDSLAQRVRGLEVSCETVPALEARFTVRIGQLIRHLKSFFSVVTALREKISSLKPDVVHANSIRAGLVATVATFGLVSRVVWHLHDLLPRHPLSTLIRGFAFLFARTRMIAVSQAVADNFSGNLFSLRNRTRVILNAIDLEEFSATDKTLYEVRRELGIGHQATVIGIVGLLTKRKRQLELVRAFASVRNELQDPALVIVGAPLFNGDREYAEQLKSTAIDLGIANRVHFTGTRNDIPELMKSFDLLVINSSVEPFGLVAIESMACGTPVLAAATGGLCEIVEHGRNGFLFKREEQLGRVIVDVCNDAKQLPEIIANARHTVATRFTAQRYLIDLEAFYCQISGAKQSAGEVNSGERLTNLSATATPGSF